MALYFAFPSPSICIVQTSIETGVIIFIGGGGGGGGGEEDCKNCDEGHVLANFQIEF